MIFKNFELGSKNLKKFSLFLLHGKNDALKNEIIEKYLTKNFKGELNKYDEAEFLSNNDNIVEEFLNKSLFSKEKIIIISRSSDKLVKSLENILEKSLIDLKIIIKAGTLEKKSKLRNLFEKSEFMIAIPFYEDDNRSLLPILNEFINKHKLKISRESINLILNRVSGNRENMKTELQKIFHYSLTNKNLTLETIKKLTNLAENYSVGELINEYLSKNTKNVAKILNENNYSDDDCILILRTLLMKSKRLLWIIEANKQVKNIDKVIMNTKPPIFWKEKESVKKQANTWNLRELKNKIYKISEIETIIKKNSKNSLNIVSDFIVNY
tara:strand:- start:1061 stop:2038 length:978 start_codon:yes stop_codon:yes gene_type:complete